MEKAVLQEKELRQTKLLLEQQRQEEARARDIAKKKEEEKEFLLQKYESTEEQASKLTRKLETLWGKYQKSEGNDSGNLALVRL
jgi:hypothetical protein